MTANLVPLVKELSYRSETPLSAYKKIRSPDSFLFHNPNLNEKTARYSFLGFDPFLVFKSKGKKIRLNNKSFSGNPLTELNKLLKKFKAKQTADLPPFFGGIVGFFAYDLVHFIEKLPRKAKDDLSLPDCVLLFIDKCLVFDHLKRKLYAIALTEKKSDALKKIEAIEEKLSKKLGLSELLGEEVVSLDSKKKFTPKIKSNFSKPEYISAIKKVKKYIREGDSFQVNLSQRFSTELSIDPLTVFEKLTELNPSPFSGFLDLGEFQIVSCSPERLVKVNGREIETRPIAGTRPRGRTEEEDQQLEKELLSNEKELAEHTMLVDLERNDLGKVCEFGSVKVEELMTVERYSHVMHLVSNIKGKLRKETNPIDVLKAVFPGGTITGCPKVRTMEIIDELEPTARNAYTGSMGWINFSGDLDLNILIRSFIVKGNQFFFQAGGGIVADSVPEKEFQETVDKAKALIEAINSRES